MINPDKTPILILFDWYSRKIIFHVLSYSLDEI